MEKFRTQTNFKAAEFDNYYCSSIKCNCLKFPITKNERVDAT